MLILFASLLHALAAPTSEPDADAASDEVDLADWEPVTLAEGALDLAGEVWLKTDRGCRLANVFDGELTVPLCETPTLTCTWSKHLGNAWSSEGSHRCERADGGGFGGGSAGSFHDLPLRVVSSEDRVVWRRVVRIQAVTMTHFQEVHPCTEATRDVRSPDVADGKRTCRWSEGVQVQIRPEQTALGVGIASRVFDEPIDCHQPCPARGDIAEVLAMNAAIGPEPRARRGAARIEIFRTKPECEASPWPTEVTLPWKVCTRGTEPSME